jgi:mycofactocin precursor
MTAVAPETVAQSVARAEDPSAAVAEEDLVLADMLVEEISIDGMCGVY